MKYYFILGRNPTLSTAEIISIFELKKIGWRLGALAPEVLIVDLKTALPEDFLRRLGGTIKFGMVEEKFTDLLFDDITGFILNQTDKGKTKKFYFGFSLYRLDQGVNLQKMSKQIKKIGLTIKKKLKEQGIGSRLVTSKDLSLSSVIVKKNKLLSQGLESVLLVGKDKIYFGKTLAVQEFEEYGFRDYQRPKRDIKSGMLPPKLAKLIVNLAQVKTNQIILDPFCGSGTILQEAALLGYQNIIGSDVSNKAVRNTGENLEWLGRNYELGIKNYEVFHSDINGLSKKLSLNSIDAIITEPYLGPLLEGGENQKQLEKIIKELSELYLKSFKEFKKILKTSGKVVMIWPVFRIRNYELRIMDSVLDQIEELGFEIASFVPRTLQDHPVIRLTKRGSVIYSRPEQRVLREIFVFEGRVET